MAESDRVTDLVGDRAREVVGRHKKVCAVCLALGHLDVAFGGSLKRLAVWSDVSDAKRADAADAQRSAVTAAGPTREARSPKFRRQVAFERDRVLSVWRADASHVIPGGV